MKSSRLMYQRISSCILVMPTSWILYYIHYLDQILAIGLLVCSSNNYWQYRALTNSTDLGYLNGFNGNNYIHDTLAEIGQIILSYNLLLAICQVHVLQILYVINLEYTLTKNKNLVIINPLHIQFDLLALCIFYWSNYPKSDDNINLICHGSSTA